MRTTEDVKIAKAEPVEFGDKEGLIEQARRASEARGRLEAESLYEQITARQALLESMKPEQQSRLTEQMKAMPRLATEAALPAPRTDFHAPACISYQVMRPPFTTNWYGSPSRAGVPVRLETSCVNMFTNQNVGLTAASYEAIPSEGALSVQAAIGDFFNARCQNIGSYFLGEGNRAFAALGAFANTGIVLPSPGLMAIDVDLEMEGQVGWSNFLFPGEPGSGIGLVGFIGIGGLIFQTFNGGQRTTQEATERFLFGTASAHFPANVERKPTFRLSQIASLSATPSGSLQYAFAISADLTAFRTTPIENGGYPGFAHANLTVPGTPGPLQPGTPLKVKEVRLGVYLWP